MPIRVAAQVFQKRLLAGRAAIQHHRVQLYRRDHPLSAGRSCAGRRPRSQPQDHVRQVIEALGATEANYGITNVDNKIGSVGRLPYPKQTNMRVIRYDIEQETHERDRDGRLIEAGPGEIGELIAEVLDGTDPGGFFEGYTSAEATEAKLMRNVFTSADVWVRSGDLVRFDEDDYYYFVDRIGDTFRWKSENVSTQEVEAVLGGFGGPTVINVYGVTIAGVEGRAGMAALTYDDPARFDPVRFYAYAAERLASYAVPLFVRLTV